MIRSTRATLAVTLGLAGVAALVGRSMGQAPAPRPQQGDATVRQAAAGNAGAAPAPAAGKPAMIGSLDMERVIKEYDKVKVTGENMKAEVMARWSELNKIMAEAKTEQEKYQRMTPNSPDAKKCEERFTQLKAQYEAGRENSQREFAQKEAESYATIFNEISAMTQAVAKQRGMTFVVHYTDQPVTGSDPDSVMHAMSRTVLYAEPSADVTTDVIAYLNWRYKQSGGAAPKAAATGAVAPTGAANPTGTGAGAAPARRPMAQPGGGN